MTTLLAAIAHPGHGTPDATLLAHHLTEPVHAAVLVSMLVAALAGSIYLLVRRSRA